MPLKEVQMCERYLEDEVLLGDDIDMMTDLERDHAMMKGALLDDNMEYVLEIHAILFGILRGDVRDGV